ncbi:MAG: hypothetical protein FWC50_15045 [Planctomycetaceae bacterium]|nr:hypothetical protein [Planctomycetaceae bacterium]
MLNFGYYNASYSGKEEYAPTTDALTGKPSGEWKLISGGGSGSGNVWGTSSVKLDGEYYCIPATNITPSSAPGAANKNPYDYYIFETTGDYNFEERHLMEGYNLAYSVADTMIAKQCPESEFGLSALFDQSVAITYKIA